MNSLPNGYGLDFSPDMVPTKPLIKRKHFWEKPLEVRVRKFQSLMSNEGNSNRIPIICELHTSSKMNLRGDLKFLTHKQMILKNFQGSIRKKMNFQEDTVLFFYKAKSILKNDQRLGELYRKYKAEDGFLYLQFSEINALG